MGMQTGGKVGAVWGQRSTAAVEAKGQALTVATQSNGDSLGFSPRTCCLNPGVTLVVSVDSEVVFVSLICLFK